jgi:16S rRNA (uracil1498-N3)-methyltransferase
MNKNIGIRLFCEVTLRVGEKINLESEQTHYLKNVMRCKINEKIIVFDNCTGEYLAEIVCFHKRSVDIVILEKTRPIYVPGDVWLIFCPLKKSRTDFLIEKSTELGLRKFLPTFSDKTQTKIVSLNRSRKNIVEAVEQCGGTFIPEILPISSLANVIEELPEDRTLIFCDESLESRSINECLMLERPEKVAILVGPEGGFSNGDRKLLRTKKNILPVSLGNRILRAETAAVAALTMWHGMVGDWPKKMDHKNYGS